MASSSSKRLLASSCLIMEAIGLLTKIIAVIRIMKLLKICILLVKFIYSKNKAFNQMSVISQENGVIYEDSLQVNLIITIQTFIIVRQELKMKVQANEAISKPLNELTLTSTPVQPTLTPFDQNYTLTGLIRHIESGLSELISTKQASVTLQIASQRSQMQKLVKIRQEVGVLKSIILQNINEIFNNIYPSDKHYKKTGKTNHTNSPPTLKNQLKHNKEMTIADFQVDSLNEQLDSINHLQVNQENITHHNNLYPQNLNLKAGIFLSCEAEDDERTKVEIRRMQKEITPFELPQFDNIAAIKIEEDEEDFQIDLVCYQDQKNINEKKMKKNLEQCNHQENFSPILQRPVQEQQTMQKQLKNQVNITFSQNAKPIFNQAAVCKPQPKKHLFSCTNRAVLPERHPRRKYNYLQKANRK